MIKDCGSIMRAKVRKRYKMRFKNQEKRSDEKN
jgi:hypothetical protein